MKFRANIDQDNACDRVRARLGAIRRSLAKALREYSPDACPVRETRRKVIETLWDDLDLAITSFKRDEKERQPIEGYREGVKFK